MQSSYISVNCVFCGRLCTQSVVANRTRADVWWPLNPRPHRGINGHTGGGRGKMGVSSHNHPRTRIQF